MMNSISSLLTYFWRYLGIGFPSFEVVACWTTLIPLHVKPIHFNLGFSGTLRSLFVIFLRECFLSPILVHFMWISPIFVHFMWILDFTNICPFQIWPRKHRLQKGFLPCHPLLCPQSPWTTSLGSSLAQLPYFCWVFLVWPSCLVQGGLQDHQHQGWVGVLWHGTPQKGMNFRHKFN